MIIKILLSITEQVRGGNFQNKRTRRKEIIFVFIIQENCAKIRPPVWASTPGG